MPLVHVTYSIPEALYVDLNAASIALLRVCVISPHNRDDARQYSVITAICYAYFSRTKLANTIGDSRQQQSGDRKVLVPSAAVRAAAAWLRLCSKLWHY